MRTPVWLDRLDSWLRAHRGPVAVVVVGGLAAILVGGGIGAAINASRAGTAPAVTEGSPTPALVAASIDPSPSLHPTPSPSATPSPTPPPTASTEPTTEPIPTATPGATASPPSPPPSGKIAFHADGDIWTANPDGTALTNLTSTPAIEESNAAWSADGSLLAFQSYADGGGVDVMGADGTGRRRVADGFPRNAGYFTDSLVWAPEGHTLAIAFVSGVVSIIDVDTDQRVDAGTGERWLAWSPSGRYLAWADGGALLVHDRRADVVRTVVDMGTNIRFLDWFPDERRLIFIGFGEASSDLFTINADGSGLASVLGETPASEDATQLSPDGRHVLVSRAYTSAEQSNDDIAMLELGDSEAMPLLRRPGQGIARWSGDGTQVVAERDGAIFVLELDGTDPSPIANGYAPAWQPRP